MRLTVLLCAALALSACQKPASQPSNDAAPSVPAEVGKGLDRSHRGAPAPAVDFSDADGDETNLAVLRGKPVLVNLWATWCAPCVKELPTLDHLAAQGGKLQVIAISQDTGPHASVAAFLQSHEIQTLEAYQDSKMGLSGALGAEVLPTSILFDRQGREVWRYVGDLDWTSPEAAKLLAEAGAPAVR